MITRVHRTLLLRQNAGSELRVNTFESRAHLVVPVVALVEGVIQAANATRPELVLATELMKFHQAWNGEPTLWDHPIIGGERVSANAPRVLEQWRFGRVFNAHMSGKKLVVEAWLDTDLAAEMGGQAQEVVERINAGEMIEVSVGAFIIAEEAKGIHDGQRFEAIWREIVPDHLALLPEGMTGACSNAMGCGAPRAAMMVSVGDVEPSTPEGEPLHPEDPGAILSAEDDSPTGGLRVKLQTLRERFQGAVKFVFRNNQSDDSVSDSELRAILEQALFESEPAFLGIEEVFPDDKTVIFATARDGEITWFARTFDVAENGDVTFGDATEVRPVTRFEPVTAAAACGCEDPTACECGDNQKETNMDKAKRIVALIASEDTPFTEASKPHLDTVSDEILEALEASVEDPKSEPKTEPVTEPKAETPPVQAAPQEPVAPVEEPKTEPVAEPVAAQTIEDYIKTAPTEVVEMYNREQTRVAERKNALVAVLVAAQSHFDEAALKEKTIPELEDIVALTATEIPPEMAADYSGIPTPRTLERGQSDEIPAPPALMVAKSA